MKRWNFVWGWGWGLGWGGMTGTYRPCIYKVNVRGQRRLLTGHPSSTVDFIKISNPGDRTESLPSYRMSARALPGKTHYELEELFHAKA